MTPAIHICLTLPHFSYMQLLMTYYLFLADRHGTGSGTRWALMGIAVKVAQSVSVFHS